MTLEEIFKEADRKNIGLISITDHDSIDGQEQAKILADKYRIHAVYGLELSVSFSYPGYRNLKPVSLDFLGYQFDISYQPLIQKLIKLRDFRRLRAEKILENGTSLALLTPSLHEQQKIIKTAMLPYIDGIECWHSRHSSGTIASYVSFAKEIGLMITGGSDCHQQPLLMGTVDVPPFVAGQFGFEVVGGM